VPFEKISDTEANATECSALGALSVIGVAIVCSEEREGRRKRNMRIKRQRGGFGLGDWISNGNERTR
jgi:hypothetical protein